MRRSSLLCTTAALVMIAFDSLGSGRLSNSQIAEQLLAQPRKILTRESQNLAAHGTTAPIQVYEHLSADLDGTGSFS